MHANMHLYCIAQHIRSCSSILYTQVRDVLTRRQIFGINRKLQIKPKAFAPAQATCNPSNPYNANSSNSAAAAAEACSEALLILKWGGDLTTLGETQAMRLGASYRRWMHKGGVLSLHNTIEHDLALRLVMLLL
jgi:inositol-hexakisphosphate/diphosphoinositol-pentakisphosphate 1-kinase